MLPDVVDIHAQVVYCFSQILKFEVVVKYNLDGDDEFRWWWDDEENVNGEKTVYIFGLR